MLQNRPLVKNLAVFDLHLMSSVVELDEVMMVYLNRCPKAKQHRHYHQNVTRVIFSELKQWAETSFISKEYKYQIHPVFF